VAWADIAALSGGDAIDPGDFDTLKAALQERTGWIGDSTEHTNADNLAGIDDWGSDGRTTLNSMRSIIENILGDFRDADDFNTVTGQWDAWAKQTLMAHIYGSHGGEATGIGYSGGVYNWINRPSAHGTLAIADTMPADTYHPYVEHIKALYWMIDHLRYISLQNYASGSPYWKTYQKLGDEQAGAQDAWDDMLGKTPAFYGNEHYVGINVIGTYRYQVWRNVYRYKFSHEPISGHYPSGYDSAKVAWLIYYTIYTFKGPFQIWGGTAADAAGSTNWASGSEMVELTNSGLNAYEEHALDSAVALPTASGAWYMRSQHAEDNDASVPTTSDELGEPGTGPGHILAKPTTSYGS